MSHITTYAITNKLEPKTEQRNVDPMTNEPVSGEGHKKPPYRPEIVGETYQASH